MKFLKYIIIVAFTILLGVFLGTYIYKASKVSTEEVSVEDNIYLLQYGVYSSLDIMKDSTSNLSNYFYYKDDSGYHVIIGIIKNKDLSNKIRESYNIKDNIYIKEEKINNMEFIESLKQYDNLVSSLNDNQSIINAEKQILSKYEELVLNNEQY